MNLTRAITRTPFASAARTATSSSAAIMVPAGYLGVRLFIDVTAITASPSVVFSLEIQDPISGDWKTILDSAAVTGTTTGPTFMVAYPGAVAVANVVVNQPIGRKFRVTATHADADSITFSVGAELLP